MSLARSARVPPRAIPQPTKSSRTASSQLPTAPSQEMPQTAILRYTVLGLVVLAALVAFGSWVVRRRRVSPFGVLGRALRAITDPVVKPVERRLGLPDSVRGAHRARRGRVVRHVPVFALDPARIYPDRLDRRAGAPDRAAGRRVRL